MKQHRRVAAFLLSALAPLTPTTLLADSPPNLTSDIDWTDSGGVYDSDAGVYDANFGGVDDIEAAFNHARREEEKQLGLPQGKLGNLDLPPQATWDSLSDDARALYLVNAERTARAGMKPGVIGLPLAGIESHIDAVSHAYGNLLHDYDLRGHYHDGTPSYRIERAPVIGSAHRPEISYPSDPSQTDPRQEAPYRTYPKHDDGSTHYFGDSYRGKSGCHEFITRSENLAYYASTAPIPLPIERSIYSFIYDDASSHWGHREAVLLQDNSLGNEGEAAGFSGFDNNHGSPESEGFMGFYVRSSNIHDNPNNTYQPFADSGDFAYGTVVVMNMFDPVADGTAGCSYDVTLRTEDLPSASGDTRLTAVDDSVSTAVNTAVVIAPLSNDAGTDNTNTLDIARKPKHGDATIIGARQIRYLPAADFTGTDSFQYRVSAKDGQSDNATIVIAVRNSSQASDRDATSTAPAAAGGDTPATADTNNDSGGVDGGSGSNNPWWLAILFLAGLKISRRAAPGK